VTIGLNLLCNLTSLTADHQTSVSEVAFSNFHSPQTLCYKFIRSGCGVTLPLLTTWICYKHAISSAAPYTICCMDIHILTQTRLGSGDFSATVHITIRGELATGFICRHVTIHLECILKSPCPVFPHAGNKRVTYNNCHNAHTSYLITFFYNYTLSAECNSDTSVVTILSYCYYYICLTHNLTGREISFRQQISHRLDTKFLIARRLILVNPSLFYMSMKQTTTDNSAPNNESDLTRKTKPKLIYTTYNTNLAMSIMLKPVIVTDLLRIT
jgi:hypothetical protein